MISIRKCSTKELNGKTIKLDETRLEDFLNRYGREYYKAKNFYSIAGEIRQGSESFEGGYILPVKATLGEASKGDINRDNLLVYVGPYLKFYEVL